MPPITISPFAIASSSICTLITAQARHARLLTTSTTRSATRWKAGGANLMKESTATCAFSRTRYGAEKIAK